MRGPGLWSRYWFAPGGRLGAAIVRIALAIAVLVMLDRIRGVAPVLHPDQMAAAVYHPVGILLVFPTPPAAVIIDFAGWLAVFGALGMLVGFYSRAATALCLLGALTVACQAMSYQPTWSHDLNVVLLALIAFLGARGGDALSIDNWLRRKRGVAPPVANYQWSLRLVQVAVGLMFLSACVLKLRSGGLHWAWSDNLRHQLLARYDLIGSLDRPPIVNWLLEKSWRYEAAATMNLVSQAMPLVAIVFVNRPLVRALAGLCFVMEVVALYVVMELGNPSWFPLAAVFIDWDRLWTWLRTRAKRPPIPSELGLTPRRTALASIFIACFVLYDLAISFTPTIDQRLRTYPFSRFPMFAIMRAKQPYTEHQTYELVGGRIELVTDRPIPGWVQAEIDRDYVYRTLHRETDREALHRRMTVLLAELQQRYPMLGLRGVRVYVTMYQALAYPAPANLAPHDIGILGELVGDAWRSVYVPAPRAAGSVKVDPGMPLALFREGLPADDVLVVTAGVLALPAGRDMLHVVARLPGSDGVVRPYIVTRRTGGYW